MRGKVSVYQVLSFMTGITPAYAGKSVAGQQGLCGQPDHPRVCGEKSAATRFTRGECGSPPRMRGKVIVIDETVFRGGITPAYAGKSVQVMVEQPKF